MNIDKGVAQYNAIDLTAEKLAELIDQKASFKVINIKDMSNVIWQIEHMIEEKGLKCRVYTEYRSAAMASTLIPTGVTQIIGLASAVGIGIHNLATYNPDYEIGKNEIVNTVSVINKKA